MPSFAHTHCIDNIKCANRAMSLLNCFGFASMENSQANDPNDLPHHCNDASQKIANGMSILTILGHGLGPNLGYKQALRNAN